MVLQLAASPGDPMAMQQKKFMPISVNLSFRDWSSLEDSLKSMAWDIKVWHLLFEIVRIWSTLIILGGSLVFAEKNSKCPEETPVHGDKRLKEHLSFKGPDA